MRRLTCLDGLRGVLAVYVLFSHMAPFAAVPAWMAHPFSHGEAAVDVFFILSGMVIAASVNRFDGAPGPFLAARAARLMPVFLAVFPIAVAIQPLPRGFARMPWIDAASPARTIWSEDWPTTWPADLLTHLTMTHGLFPDGVLPNVWVSFLGSAWSLSTEWQFYALIAVLAGAVGAHRRLGGVICLLLVVAVAAMAWRGWAPPGWQFSRAFLPNKAQYFALGLAAEQLRRQPGAPAVRSYLLILGTVLAICVAQGGLPKLAAPLVWTACLAAQLAPSSPVLASVARLLRHPLLLWLGAVSYPLYLVNEPVQKLLGVTLAAAFPGQSALFTALWIPAAILGPLAAAAWLHRNIEKTGGSASTARRSKAHRSRSDGAPVPGLTSGPRAEGQRGG